MSSAFHGNKSKKINQKCGIWEERKSPDCSNLSFLIFKPFLSWLENAFPSISGQAGNLGSGIWFRELWSARSSDDGKGTAPGGDCRDGIGAQSRAAPLLWQELGWQQHLCITWDGSQAPAPPFPEGSQARGSLGMLAQPWGGEMELLELLRNGENCPDGRGETSWHRAPIPAFQTGVLGGFWCQVSLFFWVERFRCFGNVWPGSSNPCRAHPNLPALPQAPFPHSAAFPSGESIKKILTGSQFLLFLGEKKKNHNFISLSQQEPCSVNKRQPCWNTGNKILSIFLGCFPPCPLLCGWWLKW